MMSESGKEKAETLSRQDAKKTRVSGRLEWAIVRIIFLLFLTILGHDIKAGINLTAGAGIKAYAEVQPTFEYQEKAGPGGKVGEAWLRGHFEAAAQLFLKLSGEFFVELDSPWWSPAPDKRWPYPLFDVEYPLGKSMGIGGDVDWLVGSPELPELKFSPVEFDPDKFTSDIMADPPPKAGGGKGGEQNPEGKWEAGGDKKDAKPETKDNPGLKGKKEPAEDVSKMTNDQKFIRACEKIGKIGDDAKSKPLALMQLQEEAARKAAAEVPLKFQSTYGIQSISIKDKDGEAKVTVKHPGKEKQNTNEKEPIKVRLMTVAEKTRQRLKLAEAGKKDLEDEAARKAAAEVPLISEDPKAHTMKETDAQAIAEEVKGAHYVFEDVTVAQKGDHWEYTLNLAGKTMPVVGSGIFKENPVPEKDGKGGDGELGATEKFEAGGEKHTLWLKVSGGTGDLWVASVPRPLNDKLLDWKHQLTGKDWDHKGRADKKARIQGMIADVTTKVTAVKVLVAEALKDPSKKDANDKKIEALEKEVTSLLHGLFIEFKEQKDVDFKIIYATELERLHNKAQKTIRKSVDTITENNKGKGLEEIRSYGGLQEEIKKTDPGKKIIASPTSNGEEYEGYVLLQIEKAGKDELKAKYTDDKKNKKIVEINTKPQSEAALGLRNQIFDKGLEPKTDESLRKLFSSDSEHTLYKPDKITNHFDGDALVSKYEYTDESKKALGYKNFEVRVKIADITNRMVEHTVTGFHLAVKLQGTRGQVASSGELLTPGSNKGIEINSAHILADWFQGSGYKTGLNLVATSKEYNQEVMFDVEESIAESMRALEGKPGYAGKQITFNLKVTAKYKVLATDSIISNLQKIATNTATPDELHTLLSGHQSPRRCDVVTYDMKEIFVDGVPDPSLFPSYGTNPRKTPSADTYLDTLF